MATFTPRMGRVCLATTATVKSAVAKLLDVGCDVKADYNAGTIRVHDGPTRVYQAIQKGSGGPWLVATTDSDFIRWS